MNALILGSHAVGLATTLSKDLLFKAVYSTSIGIVTTCKYMVESDKPYMKDVLKVLKRLDIQAKIDVLHDFIKEQENKHIPNSVHKSLINVSETLDNVHKELNFINNKIKDHKEKYFISWRTLDCTEHLAMLEYYNKILDNRVKLMFDLLKINS